MTNRQIDAVLITIGVLAFIALLIVAQTEKAVM